MKRIVTSAEMRQIDRLAIETFGIPGIVLMENAGRDTAALIHQLFEGDKDHPIAVFCGKGNNGGDGFVIARHLFNHGYDVHVYLTCNPEHLQGDAKINYGIIHAMQLPVEILQSSGDFDLIHPFDMAVDALLGTGIRGEVTGFIADLIHWINMQEAVRVAVDVPSGLDADTGFPAGVCIEADVTATMAEYKRGLLLPPGSEYAGDVHVMDISAPFEAGESLDIQTYLLEDEDIHERLPERPATAHKGDFGKVFVLAGSTGLTGAAALCSKACLASGAGLVVLGTPDKVNTILEEKLTEVMTKPLASTEQGTLSASAKAEIESMLQWADTLAIGPGLGSHPETNQLIREVVQSTALPCVLDADGINAFKGAADSLAKHPSDLILTPHIGELARLTGRSIEVIEADRIETAREWARTLNAVLVLKGAPTIIAGPDGLVLISNKGNSGMATAGAGDVLTGLIAGLLGQKLTPIQAAAVGVYIHGKAGELATEDLGERCLIAGSLIDFLPKVFKELESHA